MDDLQIIADKIRTMEIRGAGRIAVAASAALRDYAKTLRSLNIEEFNRNIDEAAKTLVDTRPTAVSLPNAVALTKRHSSTNVYDAIDEIVSNSDEFIKNAEEALGKIGRIGAERIHDGDVIMTHCNSHAAISIIKTAFDQGKNISVIATESRPRRQGFITIRELNDYGIPTTLIVDSAVRLTMKEVDLVVVGADSISVNGALINKIGTSQLAMAAQEARRNLIVAAETYKFSPRTLLGEMVEIEDRGSEEVIDPEILEELPNVKVRNPAFDVTPAEYIDLIITEVGALPPAMAYTIIKDHLGLEMLP
ncbi:ribose 1,5-bisphosphate isomerase [Methanolobus zinderi]|jgi:ribose 1,5-bisphosphate isomerase|uniref:Ribose 1,5-bisphosphate isomerase n=1 Tax=Methanolobus zinderi TaxID=536044 RepID=A0A7D5IMG0_9EURY|nr:ribose 1,5-bisphosphate isomerase [Methanolobus zinderi]KXS43393.1 MAG: translation initiation factor IF-2B subunit delta [Methanolobus sp. T82-4]QLC48905.1 ribose 1,5-bisphosphate isomerase [Methanolobus zinderi]